MIWGFWIILLIPAAAFIWLVRWLLPYLQQNALKIYFSGDLDVCLYRFLYDKTVKRHGLTLLLWKWWRTGMSPMHMAVCLCGVSRSPELDRIKDPAEPWGILISRVSTHSTNQQLHFVPQSSEWDFFLSGTGFMLTLSQLLWHVLHTGTFYSEHLVGRVIFQFSFKVTSSEK